MASIRIVRTVTGAFVLVSSALGMEISPFFVDSNWLWLGVFIGFSLFQSGVTNFCPLEAALKDGDSE